MTGANSRPWVEVGRQQYEKQAVLPAVARDRADLICRRLSWLDEPDRLLLELVYLRGSTCRQIAGLRGLRTSSVTRRVRKLTNQLTRPDYPLCLRHRSELTPLELKIARDWFAAGLSRREIARRRGLSLYQVDRILRRLKALVAAHRPKPVASIPFPAAPKEPCP